MPVDIHTARAHAAEALLGVDTVVGVGVAGDSDSGQYLVVLVERPPDVELPDSFEGHPVTVQVVGHIRGGPWPDDKEES